MAFFVAVPAASPTQVTCRHVRTILVSILITILIIIVLLIGLNWLGGIDSDGRGGVFLLLLPLIILPTIFLLIAPGSRGRLWMVGGLRGCQRFGTSGLRFFHPGILYWLALAVALAVSFGRGSVGRPKASRIVLIHVASDDPRP